MLLYVWLGLGWFPRGSNCWNHVISFQCFGFRPFRCWKNFKQMLLVLMCVFSDGEILCRIEVSQETLMTVVEVNQMEPQHEVF